MAIINLIYGGADKPRKPRTPDVSRTLFYYDFENNLNDSSGNGNNITSYTGISYEQVGGQYVVTNSSTSAGLAPSVSIGRDIGSGDFAISLWLYPKASSGKTPMVFGQYSLSSPYPGPTIFYNYNVTNGLCFRLSANNQQFTSSITTDTRHHLVFTRNNGVCTAYVDKSKVLERSDSTSWTEAGEFFIFSRTNSSGQQRTSTGVKGDKYIYEKVGWSKEDVENYFETTKSIYGIS